VVAAVLARSSSANRARLAADGVAKRSDHHHLIVHAVLPLVDAHRSRPRSRDGDAGCTRTCSAVAARFPYLTEGRCPRTITRIATPATTLHCSRSGRAAAAISFRTARATRSAAALRPPPTCRAGARITLGWSMSPACPDRTGSSVGLRNPELVASKPLRRAFASTCVSSGEASRSMRSKRCELF
jgi:hypothetical protein